MDGKIRQCGYPLWLWRCGQNPRVTRNVPERAQHVAVITTARQNDLPWCVNLADGPVALFPLSPSLLPSLPPLPSPSPPPPSPPARFYKETTGPERLDDEFGILGDDRCIDTGVFQPRYLVFACSPPRRAPGSALLSCLKPTGAPPVQWPDANWAFSRSSRQLRQAVECSGTNVRSGHGAQDQIHAHDASHLSQHFSQPTAAISPKHKNPPQ